MVSPLITTDHKHNTPDTIIVGAGAAGLLLAARLAEAGEQWS
jgi:Predicted flavoproteins